MVFAWFTHQRRSRLLAAPFPDEWRSFLAANVRHYPFLSAPQRTRLCEVVQVFVAEKTWVGGRGFTVTDEMKVTVAGQAAVLTLGQEEAYYFDHVASIILYPGWYRHPTPRWRSGWIVHVGAPVAGEAWHRGPIVLAWQDVVAEGRNEGHGHNLVAHEFAHHLDDLDGAFDGTPPLAGREQQENWRRITEREYLRLVGQARRNEIALLDHYGASNEAEFFAVATECFFEQPRAMERQHAELYGLLRDFYRQDPARWLPDALVPDAPARARQREEERALARRQRKALAAALRGRDANALFTLAVGYFDEGRYRLAARLFTRVLERDPEDGEAHYHRALARLKLGRYAEALADCDAALAGDPDDLNVYRARTAAYLGLGRYEEGADDVDRVLRKRRDDAEARYLCGRLWLAFDQPRQAIGEFERSLWTQPYAAEAYYYCGLAHRALDEEAEAEEYLAKAFQLDPAVDRRK